MAVNVWSERTWPSLTPMMPACWRSSSTACPWMEARNRHHSGVSHSGRWDCQTWCRGHRWDHSGSGQAQKRAHLSGVVRSPLRLVVLAGEVGGRWSEETQTFLRILARAKVCSEPPILPKKSRVSMEDALGRNSGVQCCSCVCGLRPRPPCWRPRGTRLIRGVFPLLFL